MSRTKTSKASRSIPKHIQRAVNARDGNRCRNCRVETEFLHYDHIFPYELGGPTTVANIQRLCPTCNTSKGSKITCHRCGHWSSPDRSHCSQCGAKFPYSKYTNTLAGRFENLSQRIGRAVIIGGSVVILLVILASTIAIGRYFGGMANRGSNVSGIINQTINVGPNSTYPVQFTIPDDAVSGRVAGGFKVTSGDQVDVLVVDSKQYQNLVNSSQATLIYESGLSNSKKINVKLTPGSYYLVFSNQSSTNALVAAEFYIGHK